MTIYEAEARVKEIQAVSGDDEDAHGKEDDLYRDFVEAVAAGMSKAKAQAIAEIILKTQDIEFARWCA